MHARLSERCLTPLCSALDTWNFNMLTNLTSCPRIMSDLRQSNQVPVELMDREKRSCTIRSLLWDIFVMHFTSALRAYISPHDARKNMQSSVSCVLATRGALQMLPLRGCVWKPGSAAGKMIHTIGYCSHVWALNLTIYNYSTVKHSRKSLQYAHCN